MQLFKNNIGESVLEILKKSEAGEVFVDLQNQFKSINDGTLSIRKIDWNDLYAKIKTIYKTNKKIVKSYCWLYPLLAYIDNYDVRIDVLERLKNPDRKSIIPVNRDFYFDNDCDCLIKIIKEVDCVREHMRERQRSAYMLRKTFYLYPNNIWLDEIASVYADKFMDPKRFVALIQEMYDVDNGRSSIRIDMDDIQREDHFPIYDIGNITSISELNKRFTTFISKDGFTVLIERKNQEYAPQTSDKEEQKEDVDMFSAFILSSEHIGKDVSIDNSIDYCKYLLVAEDIRQQLLNATQDYPKPSLKTLNRKLRNACFDFYIQCRFNRVKDDLDADNTLYDDPTDIQVYDKLYSDEYNWVRQEIENHPDNVDVIELAKYLLERIEPNTSHVSTQTQSGIPININGDIVLGNKQVGTHIDNVSSNAIGAKTQE